MTAPPLDTLAEHRCFGGRQGFYSHPSSTTGTAMRFALYTPPQAAAARVPLLWFLAGLTSTEENFAMKAGAQRVAAELGLALVAPDTSPRGAGVATAADGSTDFGLGAGFYLDATEPPFATHYRMYSYLTRELPAVIGAHFPVDLAHQAITGHSMGGHGALTIALKNPGRFASVSAFAPIVAPAAVPWGRKALAGYLGADRDRWRDYDACLLIEDGRRVREVLIDQGTADPFIESQLQPERFERACRTAAIPLELRLQPGYDHGYYFVATFIEHHLRWHHARLTA